MIDKKLLIRLFLTVIYLCVLYTFSKCSMLTVVNNSKSDEILAECITHTNPPVKVGSKKQAVKKQAVKTSNKNLGKFKLTAYCKCVKCCGKSDGITATGTVARADRTIAVDPDIISYGSIVIINNKEYVAEDCGGAIKDNEVDIFFNSHEEALEFGVKYSEVYIKIK